MAAATIPPIEPRISRKRPRIAKCASIITPPANAPITKATRASRGPSIAPTAPIILTSPPPMPPRAKGPAIARRPAPARRGWSGGQVHRSRRHSKARRQPRRRPSGRGNAPRSEVGRSTEGDEHDDDCGDQKRHEKEVSREKRVTQLLGTSPRRPTSGLRCAFSTRAPPSTLTCRSPAFR